MALDPTIIVLFGGAGALVWRKLIPSLFDLHLEGRLPKGFAILAVDRLPFRDEDLRKHLLVLDAWAESPPRKFPNYPAGTWGPKAADVLLARAGHAWRPNAD